MDASKNETRLNLEVGKQIQADDVDTIQKQKPKKKKPRSKAQMAAFEKAKAKRLENPRVVAAARKKRFM